MLLFNLMIFLFVSCFFCYFVLFSPKTRPTSTTYLDWLNPSNGEDTRNTLWPRRRKLCLRRRKLQRLQRTRCPPPASAPHRAMEKKSQKILFEKPKTMLLERRRRRGRQSRWLLFFGPKMKMKTKLNRDYANKCEQHQQQQKIMGSRLRSIFCNITYTTATLPPHPPFSLWPHTTPSNTVKLLKTNEFHFHYNNNNRKNNNKKVSLSLAGPLTRPQQPLSHCGEKPIIIIT